MVEKNNKKSLSNIPAINNDAQPYIIPLDVYKEGAWGYDISNYYKGRVNDNGTPFEVRWYEHGRLKNVQGLRPFMRGQVGKYAMEPDENGENHIVMANDATNIEITGETTDCREGGIAIYRMIDQAFPQDGIFFGYIGLRGTESDGSIRETGVDIIFKVLGSHMNMVGAKEFYLDPLEKLLLSLKQKSKEEINRIIDRNEQELKDTRFALHSMQNQLDETKTAAQKLGVSLGGLQAQVDAGGLETQVDHNKDIEEVRNRIDNRLSKISSVVPAFASLDDLKAKHPVGAEGLYRVGNTGYIWKDNAWVSVGELNSSEVVDADYTERQGYFMDFGNNMMPTLTETRDYLKDSEQNYWHGTLNIPEGQIITLGSEGKFHRFDTAQTVDFAYKQSEIDNYGSRMLTFYFDGVSSIYPAFEPKNRNDVVIFSIYDGKLYGLNTEQILINGKLSQPFYPKANIMYFPGVIISVTSESTGSGSKRTTTGTITIPKRTLIYNNVYDSEFYAIAKDINLDYSYTQEQVSNMGLYNVYYSIANKTYYGGFSANSPFDLIAFSLYDNEVYASGSLDCFTMNGKPLGGHQEKEAIPAKYMSFKGKPITITGDSWSIDINIPASGNYIALNGTSLGRSDTEQKINFEFTQSEVDSHKAVPGLFLNPQTHKLYMDWEVHDDQDLIICNYYAEKIYNADNLDGFIVNGKKNGGWGEYEKKSLTDWRISANSGQAANIIWLGDSTWEGYQVKENANITANYINNYLSALYKNVRSYNASRGGWTTQMLVNDFDNQTKDIPNIKLVLIGGGINDGSNVEASRNALKQTVDKVYSIGATPVIATTQVTAVPYVSQAEGGDWTITNLQIERINEMHREFARENNIALLDLEKLDTKFAEFSNLSLNKLFTYRSDYNDYLHGIDELHKFEAQAVLSFLAGDQVEWIKETTPVTIFTMRAQSELSANKYQKELDNDGLNAKGFKAQWVGSNIDNSKKILEYNFFIPAGLKKYSLNGYNLGDDVAVTLNGRTINLSESQKIQDLEAGYYHVEVKPTTGNFEFVGLEIK